MIPSAVTPTRGATRCSPKRPERAFVDISKSVPEAILGSLARLSSTGTSLSREVPPERHEGYTRNEAMDEHPSWGCTSRKWFACGGNRTSWRRFKS